MEKFQTSIFERSKARSRKRLLYNIGVLAFLIGLWTLFLLGLISLRFSIILSGVIIGVKLYDDKFMGITAYGERKDPLVITEEYLEVRGVQIPYTELTNLVIYVDEYLGMPKEVFGIHHGGNNQIQFERNGKSVTINYVIKNKLDFDRVGQLVRNIETNPAFKNNLRKL